MHSGICIQAVVLAALPYRQTVRLPQGVLNGLKIIGEVRAALMGDPDAIGFRGGGVIGPGSGNGNRGTPWEQAAPASPQKGCGFQSSGSCCFVPRFN